ncbi:18690_t:CDS:1, partial [Funneliformis geosporum]
IDHNSSHANIIPQTDDSQHNLRKCQYNPSSKQPSLGKSQQPSSSSKGSSSSTSGKHQENKHRVLNMEILSI